MPAFFPGADSDKRCNILAFPAGIQCVFQEVAENGTQLRLVDGKVFWKFKTNGKVCSGLACFFPIIADYGIDCIIFAPGPGCVWGKRHAVLFDIRFQILCFPAAQVILDYI